MNLAEKSKFRSKTLPLLLLVLITLLAYLNAWPDNLVLDDKVFSAAGRYSGMTLMEMSHFFTDDLWASHGGNSGLYRPLLLITFVTDAFIFGDWAAGYHLTNILLHLIVTLLVFGFTRYLLLTTGGQSPMSDYAALLAAAIFAVHPIHTEVVNSIFNRSGMLVSIGVVGGLWWFLKTQESSPLKAWIGVALVYLMILFCKENSAIFPALIVTMIWLFTPGNWREHVRKSLPVFWLLIPLAIYFVFRYYALETPELPSTADTASAKGGMKYVATVDGRVIYDLGRLKPAVAVWFESLRLLVWPSPLQIYYDEFLAGFGLALTFQLILAALAIMCFRKNHMGLIAGLAFFYIAYIPASRIIGESGVQPHVAERYIYLPSIGGAIALAFGLHWLARRFSLRAVSAGVLVAIVVLTSVTLARNAEWANDVLLYESEYRQGVKKGRILPLIVGAHLRALNYSRAAEICDENLDTHESRQKKFHKRCGTTYSRLGRFEEAERAFLIALKRERFRGEVHQKLAAMYLHLGQGTKARKHFELSVETEINALLREYRAAYMLMKLYPSNRIRLLEAKSHLEQALQMQPLFAPAQELMNILNEVLGND